MSLPSSPLAFKPLSPAEIDRLIAEVARRHGFVLDRDDPVLATVTLNELTLSRALAQLKDVVEAAKLEIAAGAARQSEAAKNEASVLITAAAEYADEQFRQAAKGAADEVRAGLLQQLAEIPGLIDAEKLSRTASFVQWTAALVYLAATLTALMVIALLVFTSLPVAASCSMPQQQPAQR
jgi:hypothetical protein